MYKQRIHSPISALLVMLLTSSASFYLPLYAGTLDGAAIANGNNVSIGLGSEARESNSTAIGENSFATSSSSSSVGSASNASGINSTALGAAAYAEQTNTTATGTLAQALGAESTALGANALAENDNTLAIGTHSSALGLDSIAIGQQATADESAQQSIALGNNSYAGAANTVSVGNSNTGLTRRISNVSNAIYDTDAVNLGQLRSEIDHVKNDASAGIASAAAFNPAVPSAPGKTAVSLGTATYRGEQAIAISVHHRMKDSQYNTQISGGISYDSRDNALGKMGVAWEF